MCPTSPLSLRQPKTSSFTVDLSRRDHQVRALNQSIDESEEKARELQDSVDCLLCENTELKESNQLLQADLNRANNRLTSLGQILEAYGEQFVVLGNIRGGAEEVHAEREGREPRGA